MEQPYQDLLEENIELHKALTSTKELVERFRADNDGLKRMHEDFKVHYERLKKEHVDLQKTNAEVTSALRETRMQYETQIGRLRNGLDQKKKELDEALSRMVAPLDGDMLRIKLINEIEGPHRMAIERLTNDLNAQEAKVHQLSSQYQLLQLESRNYRTQAEKEYQELEQRYLADRTSHANELQSLHAQIEELSDPEPLRVMKKERDDLRRRLNQQSIELDDLTKSREKLKSEKSVLQIQASRELEEERDLRHAATNARDSLQLQCKDLQDQLTQLKLQYELKSQVAASLGKERDELRVSSKVFEDQVAEYRADLARLRDESQRKVTDLELKLRRTVEANEQKLEKERQEKERLVKELESAEKVWKGGEEKGVERGGKVELDRLQRQLLAEQEEVALLKASASKMQQENDIAKETSARLKDREEQLRSLQAQLHNKDTTMYELQTTLKSMEDSLHANEKELAAFRAKASTEDARTKMAALKGKVREYKGKVRLCNEKLQEFGRKLAQSELERQRMGQLLQARVGVNPQLSSLVGASMAYEDARLRRDISEVSSRLQP